MVIEALRWPNWLGAKVTSRVQLATCAETRTTSIAQVEIRGVSPGYRHAVDSQL